MEILSWKPHNHAPVSTLKKLHLIPKSYPKADNKNDSKDAMIKFSC
jgi:hypothetical protein